MKTQYPGFGRVTACITYIIVSLSFASAFGQTTDNAIRVGGVVATRFYAGRADESGLNEYRYKLTYNAPLGDPDQTNCVEINTAQTGWHEYFDGVSFFNSFGEIIASPFSTYSQLHAEMWENDNDPECEFNSGDDMHCGPDTFTFRYIDYPPGIENTVIWDVCSTPSSQFSIEYKFRYGLPKPSTPNLPDNGTIICDNSGRVLSTVTGLGNAFNQPWLYRFETVWEFQAGAQPWKELGIAPVYFDWSSPSPKSDILFDLRNHPDLKDIVVNTFINYRVKTRMTVVGGGVEVGSVFESVYSYPDQMMVLGPKAPTINTVTVTPSCVSSATGTVTASVSGFGEYRYILRTGNNTTPCDPELGTCGTGPSGIVTSNTFTINNVAHGLYTLLVANKGGATGVCYSTYLVAVGTYEVLESSVSGTGVSCFGSADGTMQLTGTGGRLPLTYRVTGNGVDLANNTGSFASLPAGVYDASVVDACNVVSTKKFTITTPPELKAVFTSTNSNCTSASNGSLGVSVAQGAGLYRYELLRNGVLFRSIASTSATSWSHGDLGAGNYVMKVYDLNVGTGACHVVYTASITEPMALTLPAANIVVTDVACNGTPARISLVNESLSAFRYELLNLETNEIRQPDANLEFRELGAGRFRIIKRRTAPGCTDVIESGEITVSGAASIHVSLVKTDVTCFGSSDGKLVATAEGGTADDVYKWELKLNGAWTGLPTVGSVATGLASGTYRVTVTTPQLCGGISDEVTIEEPSAVVLSKVSETQAGCQGTTGTIHVRAEGGVLPYTYIFTSSAGVIQSSTEETIVQPGSYSVAVKDAHGCETTWPQKIEIRPNGGPIVLELVSKTDVKCSGDRDGEIVVRSSGGVAPFVYSLNGVETGGTSTFGSLAPGDYTIQIRDVAGCSDEVGVTVGVVSKPIDVSLSKKDVTCFGQQDASITATVKGGVEPFTFSWEGRSASSPVIEGIGAGTYTLRVTDQQGCQIAQSLEIVQPPAIVLDVSTVPVCAGQATGKIEAIANGGVPPYQYTLSNEYGSSPVFEGVAAGTYTLQVRDVNGCVVSARAEITVENDRPQVDFIVASKENARDTLVVREISVPKPDRTEWIFGSGITVIGNPGATTQIMVQKEGTYPITMNGYFRGCMYSKTAMLEFNPYNPDDRPQLRSTDLVIRKMEVTPNPTNGPFTLLVELAARQSIAVTVYDLVGVVRYQQVWDKALALEESLVLDTNLPVGIYIVRVVTNTDARQLQIVLTR